MPLSDAELLNYSEEHLSYEIQMFFRIGWILVRLAAIPPMDSVGLTIKNALIESFVTHLRNLGSFLSSGKAKFPDDVLAKDFFQQPDEWNPRIPTPLAEALKRSDKEVAHLTASRIAGTDPRKDWQPGKRMVEIKPLVEDFVKRASPSKLHSSVNAIVGDLDRWSVLPEEDSRFELFLKKILV